MKKIYIFKKPASAGRKKTYAQVEKKSARARLI